MDFLKKHYEKILLGVVLLGLVVGAIFLMLMVPSERAALDAKSAEIINRPPKPVPALDIAAKEQLLQRLQIPITLDLGTPNKLFNPMVWRKRSDATPIKDIPRNIGPEAVVVLTNRPLHLVLTLDAVSTSGATPRYTIGVVREAAPRVGDRVKKQKDATLNLKNDTFVLREVKGPAESPVELVLELNDTSERVSVARDRPFKRVDGYTADLKYSPENKPPWASRRVGDVLRIEGEDYIIVAINKNEVILSAKSNNKKTSVPYNAGS